MLKLPLLEIAPEKATVPTTEMDELPEIASPLLESVTDKLWNEKPLIALDCLLAVRLKLPLVAIEPATVVLPMTGKFELPETASPLFESVTEKLGNEKPLIALD